MTRARKSKDVAEGVAISYRAKIMSFPRVPSVRIFNKISASVFNRIDNCRAAKDYCSPNNHDDSQAPTDPSHERTDSNCNYCQSHQSLTKLPR